MASCDTHGIEPNSTSWRCQQPCSRSYSSPGIAFFQDGSTGTALVIGTYDAVIGVGATVNGYYTISFADGSELWLKYAGTTKTGATGKIAQKGTATVISGKGRYAGVQGDGTFEGEQNQSAALPGEVIAYIDNVINIKK